MEGFYFSIMKAAEIKVSYINKNEQEIKISGSSSAYGLILNHWDLNIIDFMEEVKVILLNRANIVLGVYELAKGGSTSCVVDIKIILNVAIKAHASSIILVHNHPTGQLNPSQTDKNLTHKLKEACKIVDLDLLDHLIISKESYTSFSDEGLL